MLCLYDPIVLATFRCLMPRIAVPDCVLAGLHATLFTAVYGVHGSICELGILSRMLCLRLSTVPGI